MEENDNDIVIKAQDVNSAVTRGFMSAAKNMAVKDINYLPKNISPEIRQIYDYRIVEKESATTTQKNFKSIAIVSSSLATWYITSGIIKVAVTTTASIGAGSVMPGIGIAYCAAKSISCYLNKEYESSVGFSLYGGIIITSTASTLFPLWKGNNTTTRDLVNFQIEKDAYRQYIEGYKKPLNANSFTSILVVILIIAIVLKLIVKK